MGYMYRVKLLAALKKIVSSSRLEIKGTDCPFTKLLITYFLNFLQEKISISVPRLKVHIKKIKKEQGGFVDFSKFLKGEYSIIIANDLSPLDMLVMLAHEYIHLVQFVKKDLQVSDDKKSLIWKGKSFGVDDYDKAKTKKIDHANFPWEKQAHEMQEELVIQFKSSTQMQELKNKAGLQPK